MVGGWVASRRGGMEGISLSSEPPLASFIFLPLFFPLHLFPRQSTQSPAAIGSLRPPSSFLPFCPSIHLPFFSLSLPLPPPPSSFLYLPLYTWTLSTTGRSVRLGLDSTRLLASWEKPPESNHSIPDTTTVLCPSIPPSLSLFFPSFFPH